MDNSEEEDPFLAALKVTYQQHLQTEKQNRKILGVSTHSVMGKKYLITYAYVDKMNRTLVKAQLYDEVFHKLNTLKYTYILITAGFLLMAFLAAVMLSRRFYKPINRLVQQFVTVDSKNELDRGRMNFLT